ncbi:hypothetical protein M153_3400021282 [Pseudoloma neurophilia]|uniref:Uncharacterized protein n=1 Tax=Pseudoloma neurophilia TaxID=146866 RepID=A0A0R0M0W0_9MICR|nr:hypothetical protein M153_3400021282 [Pseudoloma neurophilia]
MCYFALTTSPYYIIKLGKQMKNEKNGLLIRATVASAWHIGTTNF